MWVRVIDFSRIDASWNCVGTTAYTYTYYIELYTYTYYIELPVSNNLDAIRISVHTLGSGYSITPGLRHLVKKI